MNKFQKKISKMAKRENEMFGVNYKRMKNLGDLNFMEKN